MIFSIASWLWEKQTWVTYFSQEQIRKCLVFLKNHIFYMLNKEPQEFAPFFAILLQIFLSTMMLSLTIYIIKSISYKSFWVASRFHHLPTLSFCQVAVKDASFNQLHMYRWYITNPFHNHGFSSSSFLTIFTVRKIISHWSNHSCKQPLVKQTKWSVALSRFLKTGHTDNSWFRHNSHNSNSHWPILQSIINTRTGMQYHNLALVHTITNTLQYFWYLLKKIVHLT